MKNWRGRSWSWRPSVVEARPSGSALDQGRAGFRSRQSEYDPLYRSYVQTYSSWAPERRVLHAWAARPVVRTNPLVIAALRWCASRPMPMICRRRRPLHEPLRHVPRDHRLPPGFSRFRGLAMMITRRAPISLLTLRCGPIGARRRGVASLAAIHVHRFNISRRAPRWHIPTSAVITDLPAQDAPRHRGF